MVLTTMNGICGDNSFVADATKEERWLRNPALKGRAKVMPTLRVENRVCISSYQVKIASAIYRFIR